MVFILNTICNVFKHLKYHIIYEFYVDYNNMLFLDKRNYLQYHCLASYHYIIGNRLVNQRWDHKSNYLNVDPL